MISSPSEAMSREGDKRISKRLTRILRYEITSRGLVADSNGFVSFSAICRLFDQRRPSDIYRAAVNSSGSRGQRFELCQDERHGWLIRQSPGGR